MDITGFAFGVLSSLVAAAIIAYHRQWRQKSIRRKLEELEYEERFLDRLSKGNVELIRSGFKIVALTLGLLCISQGSAALVELIAPYDLIVRNVRLVGSVAMVAIGFGCLAYFKTLTQLFDLKAAKERIEKRRSQLTQKLKR